MSKARQVVEKTANEVLIRYAGFKAKLRSPDLLTGTPTVAILPSSGAPTINGLARNTSTLTIEGESHVADQAVKMTISGGSPGSYLATIQCGTVGGETVELVCPVKVI